jgi:PleD family two-component response regulator
VAAYQQTNQGQFEQFVKLADDALYASKKQGRDRCSVANPR